MLEKRCFAAGHARPYLHRSNRRQPWARAQPLYCWPFVRPECGPPLTLRTLIPALLSFHRILSTGVKHFIWSTLPDVEAISGGKFDVPHFTGKAKIDRIVKEAGFPHHTFIIAPGYYQNFVRFLAPQKQADGSVGWALPLDPDVRCLHMGDIRELGNIVAGAFAHPDEAGNGEYLPLVGDFLSFNEIVETLNAQGHNLSYKQVSKENFAGSFPGATEIAEMFSYW